MSLFNLFIFGTDCFEGQGKERAQCQAAIHFGHQARASARVVKSARSWLWCGAVGRAPMTPFDSQTSCTSCTTSCITSWKWSSPPHAPLFVINGPSSGAIHFRVSEMEYNDVPISSAINVLSCYTSSHEIPPQSNTKNQTPKTSDRLRDLPRPRKRRVTVLDLLLSQYRLEGRIQVDADVLQPPSPSGTRHENRSRWL